MSGAQKPLGVPFQKGVSGNPGGRTKAHRELARYIREKTDDGKKLADYCLKIADDEDQESRVRLLAIEWLGDRGIGKPVQAVELRIDDAPTESEAPIDWTKIPIEERERLLAAMEALDAVAASSEATEADEALEH